MTFNILVHIVHMKCRNNLLLTYINVLINTIAVLF